MNDKEMNAANGKGIMVVYCVVRSSGRWSGRPVIYGPELPVFWNRAIAQRVADDYKGKVIRLALQLPQCRVTK